MKHSKDKKIFKRLDSRETRIAVITLLGFLGLLTLGIFVGVFVSIMWGVSIF